MVIDGKKIADQILEDLRLRVKRLPFQPVFCDVIVGNDPVSLSYVSIKAKKAESIGIEFRRSQFPVDITTQDLVSEIQKLNLLPNMCGLILQLPLPNHIDRQTALNAITPELDVDVLHSQNTKKFYQGDFSLVPPTANAVVHILDTAVPNQTNKKFVVVGQGELVGKPVAMLLASKGLSVLTADQSTSDLSSLCSDADVIVSGTGKVSLITGDMVKEGAVVIDAGTAESNAGISGDVDFASVAPKASWISPVPGGVGPVTVAKLLENVIVVAESK